MKLGSTIWGTMFRKTQEAQKLLLDIVLNSDDIVTIESRAFRDLYKARDLISDVHRMQTEIINQISYEKM